MITVRIATPRFIPRRWNHRTSGSRPSVMNVAANTEKSTPERLRSVHARARPRSTPSVAMNDQTRGRSDMKFLPRRAPSAVPAVPAAFSRARRSMLFTAPA